jgi:hypothetical protein
MRLHFLHDNILALGTQVILDHPIGAHSSHMIPGRMCVHGGANWLTYINFLLSFLGHGRNVLLLFILPWGCPVSWFFPARIRGIYGNPKWLAFCSSWSVLYSPCAPGPSPMGLPHAPLRVHFQLAYTNHITTTPPPLRLNPSP